MLEDPSGRMAGRGAYVCQDGACRATALTKGGLARALSHAIAAGERSELMIPAASRPVEALIDVEGDDRGKE